MGVKRRHHYVPVSLIKRFSLPGKDPVLYIPAENRYAPTSPQNVFLKTDFHAVDKGDEGIDYESIENLLVPIESNGAIAITEYNNSGILTTEIRYAIAVFWALQYLRTPIIRDNVGHTLKAAFTSLARQADRLGLLPPIPEPLKDAGKSLTELLENGTYKITLKPHATLASLKHIDKVAENIFAMNWCLLESSSDKYFLLSDNPCAIYDKYFEHHGRGIGPTRVGSEVILPISMHRCLVASGDDIPKKSAATQKRIKEINRRTALFGDSLFIYPIVSDSILQFLKKYSVAKPAADIQLLPGPEGEIVYARNNMFDEAGMKLYSSLRPLF